MTKNQIEALSLQEEQRANRARESLTAEGNRIKRSEVPAKYIKAVGSFVPKIKLA